MILPRNKTTVSELWRCRWMGRGEPGSMAFSMRWEPSAGEFRRSRFIRRRGDAFAWAVSSSNNACVIRMFINYRRDAQLFPTLRRGDNIHASSPQQRKHFSGDAGNILHPTAIRRQDVHLTISYLIKLYYMIASFIVSTIYGKYSSRA